MANQINEDGEPFEPVAFRRLLAPLLFSNIGSVLVGWLSIAIISPLDASTVAAIVVSVALYEIVSNVAAASLASVEVILPRFLGAGEDDRAREAVGRAGWRTLTVAVGGIVILNAFGPLLIGLIARDVDVQAVRSHLIIRSLGLPLEVLGQMLILGLAARKIMRPSAFVFGANVIIKFAVGIPLIYGLGPFNGIGYMGDAWSSVIAALGGLAVAYVYARAADIIPTFGARNRSDVHFPFWKLAWPGMTSAGLDYLATALFFAIVARGGEALLVAARYGFQSILLMFVVAFSCSQVAIVLLGRRYGHRGVAMDGEAEAKLRSLALRYSAAGSMLVLLFVPLGMALAGQQPTWSESGPLLLSLVLVGLSLSWCYSHIAVLRAKAMIVSDMTYNLVAVWCVQMPVVVVVVSFLGAPFAFLGFVAYWLCRGELSRRRSRAPGIAVS